MVEDISADMKFARCLVQMDWNVLHLFLKCYPLNLRALCEECHNSFFICFRRSEELKRVTRYRAYILSLSE